MTRISKTIKTTPRDKTAARRKITPTATGITADSASSGAVRTPNSATGAPGGRCGPTKLDQLTSLVTGTTGATIAEMMAVTGWQAHSVRGAMAGALSKKRGLTITSQKLDGVRTYRASIEVASDAGSGAAR